MPIATAEQLRNRKILVKVDDDITIACRRPDPIALIANGTLPLERFHEVFEKLYDWGEAAQLHTDDITSWVSRAPQTYLKFVDIWACAAAESPRLVLTEAEALEDPAACWVQELEIEARLEIVRCTVRALASPRLIAAVIEFRRQRMAECS